MRTIPGSAPPDPTMTRRHELSDPEWAGIASSFPAGGKRGGRFNDHRTLVNGVFWRLRTGAPWRDVPERYGPWQTVYHRFNSMRKSGLLDEIIERLQLRLNEAGLLDPDLFCIDGTSTRASRAAAGAAEKTCRRAGRRATR
jgi:transposase